MRFSLILCSVDRTQPLARLLASVGAQSLSNCEVILVDQNDDDRLVPLVHLWTEAGLSIRRIRSPRGLSRARNAGIAQAGGEVFAFPDDDCWYPPTLLADVSGWLERHPQLAGVTGRTVTPDGVGTCGRWSPREEPVSRRRAWRQGNSASLFLHREAIEKAGGFDESLGLGADSLWWAGEETDYLLRLLALGLELRYVPRLRVFHPRPETSTIEKVRGGGRGMGRVMRLHGFGPLATAAFCARPLAGAAWKGLRADPAQARYYLHSFLGRVEGLLGRPLLP